MAGQGSEYARVGVLHKGKKKAVYLETDGIEHDQYLTNLSWSPDGKTIVLAIVNRAQNNYDVVAFNAKNGKRGATLFSVSNDKWAEPEFPAYWVSNKEFVWLSERDGFMNLYLYNTKGALVRQLTDNEFVATGIVGRSKSGDILFTATGEDPRESHLFSVSLKGKQKQLTAESGVHSPTVQDGGSYFITSYSSVNTPATTVLSSVSGKTLRTLPKLPIPSKARIFANRNLAVFKVQTVRRCTQECTSCSTSTRRRNTLYLVYVYGGPHAQMVTNRWNGGGPFWMNEFANRGYIVLPLTTEALHIVVQPSNSRFTVSLEPLKWRTNWPVLNTLNLCHTLMENAWPYTAGAMEAL